MGICSADFNCKGEPCVDLSYRTFSKLFAMFLQTAPVVTKWSAKIDPNAKVQRSPEEVVVEEEEDDQPLLLRMKQSLGKKPHGTRAAATPPYGKPVVSPRGRTPDMMEWICDDDDDDDIEITEDEEDEEDLSLSGSESVEGDDQEDSDIEEDQREEKKGRGRQERAHGTKEDRFTSTLWGCTARRNTPRRSRSVSKHMLSSFCFLISLIPIFLTSLKPTYLPFNPALTPGPALS